jgi:hypothetical protein
MTFVFVTNFQLTVRKLDYNLTIHGHGEKTIVTITCDSDLTQAIANERVRMLVPYTLIHGDVLDRLKSNDIDKLYLMLIPRDMIMDYLMEEVIRYIKTERVNFHNRFPVMTISFNIAELFNKYLSIGDNKNIEEKSIECDCTTITTFTFKCFECGLFKHYNNI